MRRQHVGNLLDAGIYRGHSGPFFNGALDFDLSDETACVKGRKKCAPKKTAGRMGMIEKKRRVYYDKYIKTMLGGK